MDLAYVEHKSRPQNQVLLENVDERLRAVQLLVAQSFDEVQECQDYIEDLRIILPSAHASDTRQPHFMSLSFLCCQAVGGVESNATPLAAAWFLLTLSAHLLDDLEDGDAHQTRAALLDPVNRLNVATGLIFAAQLALTRLDEGAIPRQVTLDIIKDFQRTALRICAGQHRDLNRVASTLADGWKIVAAKSGEPFALACRSGALVGGGSTQQVNLLSEFGYRLGILNQVRDDWAGIWDRSDERDLVKGQKTLPVLYALNAAPAPTREHLLALLKRVSSDSQARQELREQITELGALHYLLIMAELHQEQAKMALDGALLPELVRQQLETLLEQTNLWPD